MKMINSLAGMRLMLAFIALCIQQAILSQPSLKKLEYAFNTDPGPGNATPISFTTLSQLDTTFTLDVSGLSTGIHRLFFRVQDANNNWSLTNTTSFFKFPGNDTAATITQLEYFFDNDPGFGNGAPISFTPGNIVSDTFSFQIPDNGALMRTLYIRAKDNRGAWSLVYKHIVDMCLLYKAQPDFDFVHFGNRYTFSDSTRNDTSSNYLWKFFNNGNLIGTSTVSHPQVELPAGLNNARLIRGVGCRRDSIDRPVTTGKISSYYPSFAEAGGDVIIVLYGAGLDTSASVFLKRVANPATSIVPKRKASHTRQQLFTYFDLHQVTDTGSYFIEVVFPGNIRDTVPFRVLAPAPNDPVVTLHINGPVNIRGNVPTLFHITATNTSNKFVGGIPLWIAIPEFVNLDLTTLPTHIPANYSQELKDSVPTFVVIDSINGRPYRGKVYCIILSGINAGQAISVPIKLITPLNSAPDVQLYAWTSKRMFGSALREYWGKCFDDMFFLATGFIPVVGCLTSAFDFMSTTIENGMNGNSNYVSEGSFFWNLAGAVVSCIPGGSIISKWRTVEKVINYLVKNRKIISASLDVGVQGNDAAFDCNETEEDNAKEKNIQVGNPRDPNEIYGPDGYGPQRYIANPGKAGYTVSFENVPTATASAQRVYVLDTLDKAKFDLSTFELNSITIGDSIYALPAALKEYTSIVKIKQFNNVEVMANISLDTATGILRCAYLSIDPVSRELIDTASILGFLPANIAPPQGQGSISYSISIRNTLASGTTVANRAGIVFDKNESLLTNTWINTIDNTPPSIAALQVSLVNDRTVKLQFNSTDQHSGVQGHYVYVSVNSGPSKYLYFAGRDSSRFTGEPDSSYTFYAVPVDNVGNKGGPSAQASIDLPAGTNDEQKVLVYPNPGKDLFNIKFSVAEQQYVTVDLYSINGHVLKRLYGSISAGIVLLSPDLRQLSSGVYIIRARGDKGLQLTGKLVVSR